MGKAAGETVDVEAAVEEDTESEQYKLENGYWPTFFRSGGGKCWIAIKYVVGALLMAASMFGIVWNITSGQTAWCPSKVQCSSGNTFGACNGQPIGHWVNPGIIGAEGATSIYPDCHLKMVAGVETCV